jgi:hypothetical protein
MMCVREAVRQRVDDVMQWKQVPGFKEEWQRQESMEQERRRLAGQPAPAGSRLVYLEVPGLHVSDDQAQGMCEAGLELGHHWWG